MNFHKRCVFKVPNDCSYKKKRRNSLVGSTNSNSSLGYQSSVSSSVDGETLMIMIMIMMMMMTGASSLSTTSNYLVPPPATREGSVSPGSRNRSPSNIHGTCPAATCHVSRVACLAAKCHVREHQNIQPAT